MQLAELVAVSSDVASVRGRNAKIDRVAALLGALAPDERGLGIAYLSGELPQGKIGIGWAAMKGLDGLPHEGELTLRDVDATFDRIAALSGKGAGNARKRELASLFTRASQEERTFLFKLIVGELRQGALDGVMMDAIAKAASIDAAAFRRAAMLAGSIRIAGVAALERGEASLAEFALTPFRPVFPMLASPTDDAASALARHGEAAFELKLDGARIQAHKRGDEVRIYSRALNDVTASIPEIVALVRALPASSIILDGEAIALHPNGAPMPFQTTMRRFGRRLDVATLQRELPLSAFFFDVVFVDGASLLDAPMRERRARLASSVPSENLTEGIVTSDVEEAERFYAGAIARGHEGLMAKSLDATYEAGSRGFAWLKIKPAHTLDLVVLAVEHGSGRRQGWLSNIHLGARDPNGGFVMLGKTFKGMTDAMLAWQTERFNELAIDRTDWVVHVRPELVVEVAFNDVQASSEYEGGLALRFARVKHYRPDKSAADASTIDEVRAIFERSRRHG